MNHDVAIKMVGVSKYFGEVVANNKVNLEIYKGEILALLGENGSGKTSLMNMLSGIYFPDEGQIYVNGKEVSIRSPKDAFDLKIGMIHQHFKLVDIFSAAENIVLGLSADRKKSKKDVIAGINDVCDTYGFEMDLNKKVYDMSVSEKQTLEIIKALYRGADILILDEPTAVLTPQEVEKLLTVDTKSATEQSLTEMMVGEKIELNIERSEPQNSKKVLDIKHVTCLNQYGMPAIDDVSFEVYSGEILGIAGISGCGQKELLEAIAGLQEVSEGGQIIFTDPDTGHDEELIGMNPRAIKEKGIALSFVPEDRLGMGLVGSMGMTGNMMLKNYREQSKVFIDRSSADELANKIKEELGVVTPGVDTPVGRLSGGNVQKVLVGREIAASPKVLMTAYAVRGLDINTSYTIYNLLNEQKKKGVAVIYVGEDLDVLVELCDRILVLCDGKVNAIFDGRNVTKDEIGLKMTYIGKGDVQ